MRVLGIVPARGGSVRVPRKNLQSLGGRPLVAWALAAAMEAARLSRVIVSSDDDEILAVAEGMLSGSGLRRPAAISRADSPAIDYVRHALSAVETAPDEGFDAVAIIQPSSPFTRGVDIDGVVDLLQRAGTGSAVSVVRLPHDVHPAKMKTMQGALLAPYIEDEAQRFACSDLPPVYVRNGSVYVMTLGAIAAGTLLSSDCAALEMPRQRSVDINDAVDLAWAQFLLDRGHEG